MTNDQPAPLLSPGEALGLKLWARGNPFALEQDVYPDIEALAAAYLRLYGAVRALPLIAYEESAKASRNAAKRFKNHAWEREARDWDTLAAIRAEMEGDE